MTKLDADQGNGPAIEYRPIAEFPDYRIGSDRSVWSHRIGRWKPLRLARGGKGSPAVVLFKPGDSRPWIRCVAQLHHAAFLVPPPLPEGSKSQRDDDDAPWTPPAVVATPDVLPPRPRPIRPPSPSRPVARRALRPSLPPLPPPAAVVAPGGSLGLGPMVRGDDDHRAALESSQVIELRTLRATGWKLTALASRYGISPQAVSRIALGKAYRHAVP